VTTLANDVRGAGPHEAQWDGTDAAGSSVSSGVYFYRMKAGKASLSRRMVLLK
jgi:flagellar hook assembly protein FlgD